MVLGESWPIYLMERLSSSNSTIYSIVRGWGGVGMMTFLAFAHMVDATQVMGWGGVGMITFLALADMVDATQLMGWWGGWGMMMFLHLHTCVMLRN